MLPAAQNLRSTARHIGVARLSTRSPAAFPLELGSPDEASRSDAQSGSGHADALPHSATLHAGYNDLPVSRCDAEKIIRLQAGAAHQRAVHIGECEQLLG